MTFRKLARSNVKGNWHRYVAFFLSSTFSVMIFFIYAAFLFHPDVISGNIRAADKVRQGMILCEYIIVIFSFFFVLYSMSAFLKSRKKEFGLLSLFGMTNRQIAKLVLYENTLIALLAIAAGIGFGALFSKLFFMALAELLHVDSPIRFILAPKAIWMTVVGFFALFELITLFTLRTVGRSEIVELLKAAKKPKSVPVSSKWLTLLSVVCLAAGYYMAFQAKLHTILIYMVPILATVIVGSYFLFTQASVAILRRLQKTPGLYYRHTHLVTVAQLVFKMKDNARTFFMVAILSAVILTASGTFYVMYLDTTNKMVDSYPQSFGYTERGAATHDMIHPDELKRLLTEKGQEIAYEVRLTGMPVPITLTQMNNRQTEAMLVPEQAYNRIAKQLNRKTLQVEAGHAYYVFPYKEVAVEFFPKGSRLETNADGKPLSVVVDGQINGGIINSNVDYSGMLVVDDAEYAERSKGVPDSRLMAYYGFETRNWTESLTASQQIAGTIPEKERERFESRVGPYLDYKQFNSLTLFIGLLVSVLFFVASGSMLYFKLFTEIQDDQAQFKALTRIGVSDEEIRKITGTQIGIVFFLPVAVGIIHAAFAYKSLGNILGTTVWHYGLTIMGIYIAMQFLYFALARRAYMKQLGQG
ncbi:ABC transporter permease [Paenibacillus mesophilus]|uniref:ABC transporter permease n=1 Tax=Paenibacillus mesophilus TaxID=2582849 RepID=UPI00110E70B0|nr:ABC transporter permease [Paenibacillus mesophilus]TMV48160.1 ABC transporter permease [Paenibacillus mesophilus]